MSRDAKNSILLWAGTLAFVGLFWAGLHFEIGARIPDRWLWPMLGIVTGVNLLKLLWDFIRKRKANGLCLITQRSGTPATGAVARRVASFKL